MMTRSTLDAFFTDGWNRHDVDFLMTFMTDDCVFEGASGVDPCGARHVGRERVREAFPRVFTTFPDARFANARHVVAGERGVSEWLFTARPPTDGRSKSTAAICSRSGGARSRLRRLEWTRAFSSSSAIHLGGASSPSGAHRRTASEAEAVNA
jgi:taurine dehydrogenase small subunit